MRADQTDDLKKLYRGEVYGAATFAAAVRYTRGKSRRAKWMALMIMEEQTRLRTLRMMIDKGLAIPRTYASSLRGELEGLVIALLPWRFVMRQFLRISSQYHPLYQRLHDGASPADRSFFAYVLRHEAAFREFAARELRGRTDSIEVIDAVVAEKW